MFPILYAGLIQGQRERDVAAGTWTQLIHLIEMTLNMSSRTLLGTGLLTSLLSRSFLMIKGTGLRVGGYKIKAYVVIE